MEQDDIVALLAALQLLLFRRWGVRGRRVHIDIEGEPEPMTLPMPRPAPRPVQESPPPAGPAGEPFVPTPFQRAILEALDGVALRTDALGAAVGDRGRLFKRGGLKELQDHDLVRHHARLGYYRPDSPPEDLEG